MKTDQQRYQKLCAQASPPSNVGKDCFWAFIVGGLICLIGQLLLSGYRRLPGLDRDTASLLTSASLIALSALLTGFGLYDKIAAFAGAGTLVPITGFANAVVSPALEFKSEGYVLGTGAKMFIIAGPVIVYGVAASIAAGLISTLF